MINSTIFFTNSTQNTNTPPKFQIQKYIYTFNVPYSVDTCSTMTKTTSFYDDVGTPGPPWSLRGCKNTLSPFFMNRVSDIFCSTR